MKALRPLLLLVAIAYLGLFVFNAVARTGRFSPDSMSYVNVAQNILAGKGITQPTVGFNQQSFSLDQKPPIPFIEQAPLYPLAVALVSRTGISPARSALLLSAIGHGIMLLLFYRLATALYDNGVAFVATALLLFYNPLLWIAGWAWSEPIGIALVLLVLWLLTRPAGRSRKFVVLLSGLATGLAFATRYALGPLFGVGILFLVVDSVSWKRKLAHTGLYAIGFAVPAALLLSRNFAITGSFMPLAHPPRSGFGENLAAMWQTTFGGYLGTLSPMGQLVLLGASLLITCLLLGIRGDLFGAVRDVFVLNRRWLLGFWALGYLIFLIVERCLSYFDVDARTIAPAGVFLVLFWSALVVRAARLPIHYARLFALALLLVAMAREATATIRAPALDFHKRVNESERLSWIEKHTSDKDLIIGDNVVDIPFFFHRGATLSFSPYPYTDYPTYEKLMAYARMHCRDYNNIYLIVRINSASEDDWRLFFGDFFTDLVFGRAQRYPGIVVVQPLRDAYVFQIECR